MDLNLGIDLANRKLLDPVVGGALTLPALVQGDTVNVTLQGMQLLSSGSYALVPIDFTTIKCGIGFIDAAPLRGTFKLTVSSVSTIALDFNSTPSFIAAQLNALSTVSALGGVTVFSGGSSNVWVIAWNDPTVTTAITVGTTELFPYCFHRVITYTLQSGATSFILKLFQAPVAFTDDFALPSSPAVTCVQVQAGTGLLSEVQKLTIPADAQGEFTLTFGTLTTLVIPVATASATVIAAALNAMFSDGVTRFTVIQPGSNYYYIQFVGPLALTTFAAMTVTMLSQPPQITPAAALDLNVPGIQIALVGQSSVDMVLQLEIINGTPGTPILLPVTINAALLDSEMALAVDPHWLSDNISGLSIPNNPTQAVAVGLLGYQEPEVGDTVATSFTVNHNLGTVDVFIEVIDNNTKIRLPDDQYTATIPNGNQVIFTFTSAPTLHQYRMIVTSAYATEYLPQLSLTIDDVAGLRAALNALSSQGNPLDFWPTIPLSKLPLIPFSQMIGTLPAALLPSNVCLLDANGDVPLANIPSSIPRLMPDGSLAVSFDGKTWTTILAPDGTLAPGIFGDLSKVPSFVSSVLAVLAGNGVTPTGVITTLFQPITEIIGYRGPALTPDPLLGYKDSQLPNPHLLVPGSAAFERELWRVSINDKQLITGRTLTVDWGVALQLIRANCAAEYTLVLEQGVYADSGSPSRLNITWNTDSPIFSQVIVLTKELTVHSFGVLIERLLVSGTPTNHLTESLYGVPTVNNDAAPGTANFALRCRLISLNTETASPAKGWIYAGLVASTQPLNTTATTPQAVIRNS